MGWFILWIAGLVLFFIGSAARSGFVLAGVKTFIFGIFWAVVVGILVFVGLVFGAIGGAMDSSPDDTPPPPPPTFTDSPYQNSRS